MNIDPWILAFSAVTVAVTIWMGFWAARKSKTTSDFFVAGRSVSVGWNASAISGEYLSAASFMGVAGMVMAVGYDALWYPVCYACGYLFLLLFIAGPLRRFGAYTVPDLAEGRFDSPVFRKIAVVFVLFIGFFYTMPQMKGAGTTLAYIFPGLPYWAGVVLVGAVITLNVALGGMKGITLVQAFQYWAKMFAISVPIFVLMAVYGHYGKQFGVNGVDPRPTSPSRASADLMQNRGDPAFEAELTLTDTNLSFQKVLNEITTVTGIKQYSIAATNQTSATLSTWLLHYGVVAKRPNRTFTIYTPKDFEPLWSVYLISQPEPMARPELQIYLERSFETNGIRIVRVGQDAVKVFNTSEASVYEPLLVPGEREGDLVRNPLPETAPTDSAWLSPFAESEARVTNWVAVSTSMSLPAVNGWVTMKPSRIISRAEDRLKAFFGQGQYYSVGNAKLVSVLFEYTELSGRTVIVHTNVGLTRLLGSLELNWNDWNTTLANVERFFATNGVALRAESAITMRAMTPEQAVLWDQKAAASIRRVLPAKAPSDDTWLSPFGPLTTKAARAAGITGDDAKPYSLLYTYSLIIALVCGTAGLPHILVRFYTNPDGAAAKRTTMWVMILIGVFYVFPPIFGVMGRNLLPELYTGIGAKGTDKIVLELPRLLNEKYAPLGSILSGVTCAGAFAAFMSTFSGLLVSMTGAMAHDVYGRMLNPKATAEQRLRAFKIAAVMVGGVAILLGTLVEPLQINFMVGQAFAIAAASYFPFLFMCAWWRNLTMKGAATGMLTGGLLAVASISLTSFSDLAKATDKTAAFFAVFKPMNEFWAGHPLLRILCEQPALWAVPLAIVLMVIVSKLTRSEVPADIRMKMLVLHAPEKLGLKQEYIQEHQAH